MAMGEARKDLRNSVEEKTEARVTAASKTSCYYYYYYYY